MTADEFPRLFAAGFGAQDTAALAALLSEDAQVVSLTGAWAEGRAAAETLFAAEFAGIFRRARLVTGKLALSPIGPGAAVVHQRFVVTGAQDAEGNDLPRFAALLGLVLLAKPDGWQALSLTFSALSEQ